MASYRNLTVEDDLEYLSSEDLIFENENQKEDLKLQLEENYYEKLFIEEMNFRKSPNRHHMKNIIQKHCQAVEYFSSIGDNKNAMKYKLLNNIFLNDSQVISTLDNENKENINNTNSSYLNNDLIKNILILNKKKNSDKYIDIDDFDDININNKLNNIFNINNINNNNEQEKYDELIKKKNSFENKIDSINIINEEIQIQNNNFKRNLTLKLKQKKSINENKILQGIQNVFINDKEITNENDINNNNNEINIEKKISPIKKEQYSDKETNSSNELKFSSNNNNNDINPLLTSANNKKNTSEFEPLTPINNNNEYKSSAKQDISIISEEINETNDFSLMNNDTNNNTIDDDNNNKKEILLGINNEISLNETKYSNNSKTLSNSSPSNSITKSPNLNESSLTKSEILKSFRLDFNDLFDYIKENQNANKKTTAFCNDIKIIIENYLNDFNQHLNKNIINKIIKKFSDIWDEMFNKYTEISETFDKEIKNIDMNNYTNNKSNINELSNLIDNINIEKENALNQNEEKYNKEIDKNEIYFKNNYNKIDNGILLLNEKFAYVITKRVYDMINSYNI